MIGALILGNLADRIGRKLTMTITTAGNILSIFVLGNELVGASKRAIFGVTLQSSFAVGNVIFAVIAYYVQHWRTLTCLISILGLPLLSYHFFIPESPRWLLAKNRVGEARKVIEDIAHGNGAVLSSKVMLGSPDVKGKAKIKDVEEGVTDLFSRPELFMM